MKRPWFHPIIFIPLIVLLSLWTFSASTLTVGMDPDQNALRIARADSPYDLREKVRFTRATARHLPFSKETFDIAVLAWSLR